MREYNIVHVINCDHRPERLARFLKEADEQGFGVMVTVGEVIPHNAKMGICRSHKKIVQYAKDNNMPMVAIAEDDCRMMGGVGAWKYFVDNMPDDFDLYLSMYYSCEKIEGNRIMAPFSAMTLYFVSARFYDFFLTGIPDDCHLDRELGKHAEHFKFLFCDLVCAEQDGSRSDNSKTTCNYRPFLKGRKIFGDVKID